MKTAIYSQHQEHMEWSNKLIFYKDELKIMQKRLEEVILKNSGEEVKIKVEHFQNLIFIEEQNLSKLMHQIKHDESLIQANILNNPIAADHRKIEDHASTRDSMDFFEKNFNQIRKDLNAFVMIWM